MFQGIPQALPPSAARYDAVDWLGMIYGVIGISFLVGGLGFVAMALGESQSLAVALAPFFGAAAAVAGSLWLLVAWSLRRRRNWTYCVVIAASTILIAVPVGTVLGIYALVVLYRSETQSAFSKIRQEARLRRMRTRVR